MADDNIDFRFLGQQVKNLQGDVRDLRAGHLRLESDVVGMRADISRLDERMDRLEQKVDTGFRANDARFDQMAQTAPTNLQVLLAAIAKN